MKKPKLVKDILSELYWKAYEHTHTEGESIGEVCSQLREWVEQQDIEKLSEKVHKAYCLYCKEIKGEEYWTKGDYSKLSDKVKEADKYTVRAILNSLSNELKEE